MNRPDWFPAKRYGWGWGLPVVWQGWAVLVIFGLLLAICAWIFPPQAEAVAFVVCTLLLSALLTLVCWLTGEAPRWRWGDD